MVTLNMLMNYGRRIQLLFMFLAGFFTVFMTALMLLLYPILAAWARF
jgi:hypothetical protein